MSTTINAAEDLHHLLRERWSPREFLKRPVEPEKLRSVFEAARWAASCFNEQPWRFLVATQADPAAFARLLGLLAEKNQQWAKTAWALGFSAAKKTFSHSGAPNRFGLHDTGAAAANMAIEATALGMRTHFMGGFDPQRARVEFHVPDDFEIGAAFAIGYIDEKTDPVGSADSENPERDRFRGRLGFARAILTVFFASRRPCNSLPHLDRYRSGGVKK